MNNFMGMGLRKFVGLGIAIILFIVVVKVAVNKVPIPGVTEVVNVV